MSLLALLAMRALQERALADGGRDADPPPVKQSGIADGIAVLAMPERDPPADADDPRT